MKDGRTVVSIRTENPYGMIAGTQMSDYLADLQVVTSPRCLRGQRFDRNYIFSIGRSGDIYSATLSGRETGIPEHFPFRILHTASYGFFGDTALPSADVERLGVVAQQSMARIALSSAEPVRTTEASEVKFSIAVGFRTDRILQSHCGDQ